jgi:hypothetical protein
MEYSDGESASCRGKRRHYLILSFRSRPLAGNIDFSIEYDSAVAAPDYNLFCE